VPFRTVRSEFSSRAISRACPMLPLANKWERRSMLWSVKSAIGMPSLGHSWLGGSIGQVNFYSPSPRRALDGFTPGSIGGIMAMTDRPRKITFAEMRESGVRGLLIYCVDYRCSHSIAISGDVWPDDVRLSQLSTSGTVPNVRSSRRKPRSHRTCSHAKRSHGTRSHRICEQQRRLAACPACRCQRFPYRRDGR